MFRPTHSALAVVVVLALVGCGSDDTSADPGFAGHWTSTQWGEHYISVEGSTVKIIYTHDDGRVLGTLNASTVTGWWTEVPSRQAPRDAGDVEFTLTIASEQRAVDGNWRYSAEGPMRENWDLVWVDDKIPADVSATFADDSSFIQHP